MSFSNMRIWSIRCRETAQVMMRPRNVNHAVEPGSMLCIIEFRCPLWLLCGLGSWMMSRCVFINSHVVIAQPTTEHVMKFVNPSLYLDPCTLFGHKKWLNLCTCFLRLSDPAAFKNCIMMHRVCRKKLSRMNLQQFRHLHSIPMSYTTRFWQEQTSQPGRFCIPRIKTRIRRVQIVQMIWINHFPPCHWCMKPWWNKFMCWSSVWLSG